MILTKVTLIMNFKDSSGNGHTVKMNDVKPDITGTEVEALGNMMVNKNMIVVKGNKVIEYVDAELEITEIQAL